MKTSGGRCTAAERDRRVAQVVEWLADGQSRANMVHLARGEWDIKPRTLDAYLKRARDLITAETRAGVRADIQGGRREARSRVLDAAMPDRLDELPDPDVVLLDVYNMLYEQYAVARANGDAPTALKAAEKLAEVAGVRWSDRQKGMVEDDIEKARDKAHRGFAMMMGGLHEHGLADGSEPL